MLEKKPKRRKRVYMLKGNGSSTNNREDKDNWPRSRKYASEGNLAVSVLRPICQRIISKVNKRVILSLIHCTL